VLKPETLVPLNVRVRFSSPPKKCGDYIGGVALFLGVLM
jgi:hypothetical protein